MSRQASSVQADRSSLAITAAFLATGAATSLTLFLALLIKDELGPGILVGWALSLMVTAAVAGLSTNAAFSSARGSLILAGCCAVPAVLFASGFREVGLAMLVGGLFSSIFAIPLVEWACGLGDSGDEDGRKRSIFRFSSGREVANPIPSSLVLGMMIFAWPGDLLRAGFVAAPFFGFLLMLASLGGMFAKVRQTSSGVVAVHPRFLIQWFVACALATVLCAGLGVIGPVALGRIEGVATQRLGGPVHGGPKAAEQPKSLQSAPRPQQNPSAPKAEQPKSAQSPNIAEQPRPQFKPWEAPDFKKNLIKLLILAAIAGLLLWLARKYQTQILAFLRKVWAKLSSPFRRAILGLVAAIRQRKREAAIRNALSGLRDPYADPPEQLVEQDLPALYDKLIADLSLIAARPRESESVVAFVRRVGMVHSLDREELNSLAQILTEGAFSNHTLADVRLLEARERFVRLRQQIHESVPPEQLHQKQEAYRRQLAEELLAKSA